MTFRVDAIRGGLPESRHSVQAVVCDAGGGVVWGEDPGSDRVFLRSAAKPWQALPLVEDGVVDALEMTPAELAVCCASHEAESSHLEAVRSILTKCGADETMLRCGPHVPFSKATAARLAAEGREPGRIHNNCSGKHAGMIALAVHHGWDPAGYHRADHPVQQRMAEEVSRWTGVGVNELATAVDGCGVSCFGVSLMEMATGFARYSEAARRGEAAARVVDAMVTHPEMVGGTGRACTDVMRAAEGRAYVKLGAEGVYGGGVPDRGLGFAIKVADGARRAVEVALVAVLTELGALDADGVASLSAHANPPVLNTRDEVVGELRAVVEPAPVTTGD